LKKFGLSEDLSKAIKRRMTAKPKLRIPSSKPPKMDIKKTLANALDTRVKLEPERNYALPEKVNVQRKLDTAALGRSRVMAEGAAHKAKLEQIKHRSKTDPNFKFNPKTSQWSWSKPAATTALAKRPIASQYRPRPRLRIRSIATKGLARKVALVGTGMAATSAIAHLIKRRKPNEYSRDMRLRDMKKRTKIGGGFAAGLAAEKLRKLRKINKTKYTLTATERQYYEDGFSERWEQLKHDASRRVHGALNWFRGNILPTVARGAVTGGATMLQQEIGLRPTTIGLDPVQRSGFDQKLIAYPNADLRNMMQGLKSALIREADPVLRQGLERSLGLIGTELVMRRRIIS